MKRLFSFASSTQSIKKWTGKRAVLSRRGKIFGSFFHELFTRIPPVKWLPYNLDLLVPCLILISIAIFSIVLAVGKTVDVMGSHAIKNGGLGEAVNVKRIYIGRSEYLEYSPTLGRLNPGVTFTVAPANEVLALTINNEELFPDLMMALHTLQSFKPNVAWEVAELCVRTCPEKAVARVLVKGFKQELR